MVTGESRPVPRGAGDRVVAGTVVIDTAVRVRVEAVGEETALVGIGLVSDDSRGVLSVLRLSQASYRKMLQNLGWATGYNLLAVPVAAGALAGAGVTLAPAVGAILMSLSTIVVALNAQLLRGLDLRQGRGGPSDRPGDQRGPRDRHHHGRAGAGGSQPRHAP